MDTFVDIQLGPQYRFKFRQLLWKEEFAIRPGKEDPRRVVLATALSEISGLKIKDYAEAWRVLCPEVLPTAILERVFVIYRGTLPEDREFKTLNLYKAPEPSDYTKRVVEQEAETEKKVDVVMERAESQFSKEELEEAREVDRQILAGAKSKQGYRGAVPKADDVDDETNPLGGGYKRLS
jgi:hypothetical protein